MKRPHNLPVPWRIALIWLHSPMDAQHCLTGLYRRADQTPDMWVRSFNAEASDFRRDVLQPLKQWQPHGVIVRMTDWKHLRSLRRQFPKVPFVATVVSPPDLIDTVVVADSTELITVARDYLHKCGLPCVGLFSMATECAVANVKAAFRAVLSDGIMLACPRDVAESHKPTAKILRQQIMTEELRRLPKPVGLVTLETESAPFLLEWCQKFRLRVPQDVQIIGVDDEDQCLKCRPQLTSLALPNERIGERALETMLRYLRHEQPPPPPIIRVSGGAIISRGSTHLVKVGQPAMTGALDLMQTHATKGMTTIRLAKLARMGRTTFYKQFGAATGNTPTRHLRQLRLQEACRLLRETDDTVTAIAAACGFNDLVAFLHFFRRQTGQTPTAYRQRMARKKV